MPILTITADAMVRTKGPLNPRPTTPNEAARNLRDRQKLRRMTVVNAPKKDVRAGRSKKRSNCGQAPCLNIRMLSDEELGDEECDNEEPVPRTRHVTPPLSPLSPPPASSPVQTRADQNVRHNKVCLSLSFFLSAVRPPPTVQFCTLCQDVADAEGKGKCCSCARVVCDACLVLSPGSPLPSIVNNPTLKFVCPSCHELKDRVDGGKGKHCFRPYKVRPFLVWLVAQTEN